jgi:anti-anti-sigma factor
MQIDRVNDATIVRVREEIDMLSGPQLETVLRAAEDAGATRLLISLEDCPYCDSTFLNMVLRIAYRIGTRLGVVAPPGSLSRRIFDVAGLGTQPFVFDSVAEALEGCPP